MRTLSIVAPRRYHAARLALLATACRAGAPGTPPTGAPPTPAPALTAAWMRTGDGIACGLSGLAPAGDGRFVLVHDNKRPGEPRVAVLTLDGDRPRYRAVAWRDDAALRAQHAARAGAGAPDSLPFDLEAVAAAPGRAGTFLAVTSVGTVYRFALAGTDTAAVDAVFRVIATDSLAAGANYEGFVALAAPGGATVGVWADRGANGRPGVLRWGVLDDARGVVMLTALDHVRVPWPSAPEVRHLSDLALRGDTLLASAASDAGDAGPFASAVYVLGTLRAPDAPSGAPRLQRGGAASAVVRVDGRKVEAVAATPAGLLLGTDDELQGGLVRTAAATAGRAVLAAAEGARVAGACAAAGPPR